MKKSIIFFIFFLLVQVGYGIAPVLAENEADASAIEKVIENYLGALANGNIDSVMSNISTNYSGEDKEGKVVDYAKFKSKLEKQFENNPKFPVTDSEISELEIEDNRAILELSFRPVDVNPDTKLLWREIALAKENGSWKIIQVRYIRNH